MVMKEVEPITFACLRTQSTASDTEVARMFGFLKCGSQSMKLL